MASVMKAAARASSSAAPEETGDALVDPRDTAKYLLKVTAGPSYDASTHGLVHVNGETYDVSNEFMATSINVRIRDYHGLPRCSQSTHPYFSEPKHKDDRYSISFSFTPKKDIPGEEVIMGFDFDRPVRDRLPPLFKPALKLVTTVVDPGIYCDAYADEPYLYGAALSSLFLLKIGDKSNMKSNHEARSEQGSSRESRIVREGAEGSGEQVRKEKGIPEDSEKRRKHFLKQSNLSSFTFEAEREYEADFFNPYLDFANFALRLPGISISVARYIDEKTHTLRFVFKNRRTEEVYFVVVFTLLFGQELKDTLKGERERSANQESQEPQSQNSEDEADDYDATFSNDLSLPGPGPGPEPEPEQTAGFLASLGKWIPKLLHSGGTATGSSSPSSGQSRTRSRSRLPTPSSSMNDKIDDMADEKIEEFLRKKNMSQ